MRMFPLACFQRILTRGVALANPSFSMHTIRRVHGFQLNFTVHRFQAIEQSSAIHPRAAGIARVMSSSAGGGSSSSAQQQSTTSATSQAAVAEDSTGTPAAATGTAAGGDAEASASASAAAAGGGAGKKQTIFRKFIGEGGFSGFFSASASTWAYRAKIMFLLGLVGDVVVLVGMYTAFTQVPSCRLFIGHWAPQIQDLFYHLLSQYKGQEFVLTCRDEDEQEAANMFVQARYAHSFTRREWYKLPPVYNHYVFEDEQEQMLREQYQQQQQQQRAGANKGSLLQNLARGIRG